MYIYMTKNMVNGKIYIGQSTKSDEKYLGSGRILLEAFKKYGRDSFQRTIIERCNNKAHMNERERYWIAFYNSTNREVGYNLADGGIGGYLGPEASRLIGEANSRRMKGNKLRLGKTPHNKGVPMSEAQKEKMRRPKSEAHKLAMSKARIGTCLKPVRCTTNGVEYPSLKSAAENLGLPVPNVVQVLKGRAAATKGYSFVYVNPVYPHRVD
jgi:group I intron endonuclease